MVPEIRDALGFAISSIIFYLIVFGFTLSVHQFELRYEVEVPGDLVEEGSR